MWFITPAPIYIWSWPFFINEEKASSHLTHISFVFEARTTLASNYLLGSLQFPSSCTHYFFFVKFKISGVQRLNGHFEYEYSPIWNWSSSHLYVHRGIIGRKGDESATGFTQSRIISSYQVERNKCSIIIILYTSIEKALYIIRMCAYIYSCTYIRICTYI